ncbi:MAG: amidase [Microthrixaceae bacterium]
MPSTETAEEIARSIRAGERSAVEVMQAHLADIDHLDTALNAVCFRDDERALAEAAAIDESLRAGNDPGPFAGVPMLIKDLNDVAGWPTSHGSRATSTEPAHKDELAVARLRGAGFVISGKTTTPEFGTIPMTESERFGVTRNPWNTDHTPGGSSGGAGAAVAAGILPAAHSSDGGGSIRIPAKLQRPRRTEGLPTPDNSEADQDDGRLHPGCAHPYRLGPGSHRRRDGSTGPGSLGGGTAPAAAPGRRGRGGSRSTRIRVSTANAVGIEPDQACVEAVESTAELLEGMGHEIDTTPVEWPDPYAFLTGFLTVWATISAGIDLVDLELLEPHNQANRQSALANDSIVFSESVMQLQEASRKFTVPFGTDFDLLLSPSMAVEPPLVGTIWEGADADPSAPLSNSTPMAAYTALFNVTGQPAMSLPVSMSDAGLPVGVQVAAPPFDEAVLIRLASQLESEVRWHERALPDPLAKG